MTKPVILVYTLLYVVQGVIDKVITSWPQLISKPFVAPIPVLLLIGLAPRVFLLSISHATFWNSKKLLPALQ